MELASEGLFGQPILPFEVGHKPPVPGSIFDPVSGCDHSCVLESLARSTEVAGVSYD